MLMQLIEIFKNYENYSLYELVVSGFNFFLLSIALFACLAVIALCFWAMKDVHKYPLAKEDLETFEQEDCFLEDPLEKYLNEVLEKQEVKKESKIFSNFGNLKKYTQKIFG